MANGMEILNLLRKAHLGFDLEVRIYCSKIREHSLFRVGGGPEKFREGSLTFCLPKKGGSA